jgi:hypothetical protein
MTHRFLREFFSNMCSSGGSAEDGLLPVGGEDHRMHRLLYALPLVQLEVSTLLHRNTLLHVSGLDQPSIPKRPCAALRITKKPS